MTMMTEQTRTAVWGTLCDLEWNKRYYAAMADKYKHGHLSIRFAIISGLFAEGFIPVPSPAGMNTSLELHWRWGCCWR